MQIKQENLKTLVEMLENVMSSYFSLARDYLLSFTFLYSENDLAGALGTCCHRSLIRIIFGLETLQG